MIHLGIHLNLGVVIGVTQFGSHTAALKAKDEFDKLNRDPNTYFVVWKVNSVKGE